ncbi:hypothetical protein NLJ89_g7291 [Agrocybe chaxingu]|uniref:Uncharacterized protein n=1 Tax=Agrocybe chaxingu TaxID=84603 RepID=A0A9W8K4S1_9AGAR|nr:hypothetical protein NLJ89_g7291 [Agrocybe chaxingu]
MFNVSAAGRRYVDLVRVVEESHGSAEPVAANYQVKYQLFDFNPWTYKITEQRRRHTAPLSRRWTLSSFQLEVVMLFGFRAKMDMKSQRTFAPAKAHLFPIPLAAYVCFDSQETYDFDGILIDGVRLVGIKVGIIFFRRSQYFVDWLVHKVSRTGKFKIERMTYLHFG